MHAFDPLEHYTDAALELLPIKRPFIRVIDDVIDEAACAQRIADIEARGPTFAPITTSCGFVERPDIRNNDRVMFDDVAFATDLFTRLQPQLPARRYGLGPHRHERRYDDDREWVAVGLNERFRGYRYQPGQRFAPHMDGAFERNDDERSAITVILYLNSGFVGGQTRFLDWDLTVEPLPGRVLLFDHSILHEGVVVDSGAKYALRSDVMYRAG
jgi:hypothetical protein